MTQLLYAAPGETGRGVLEECQTTVATAYRVRAGQNGMGSCDTFFAVFLNFN